MAVDRPSMDHRGKLMRGQPGYSIQDLATFMWQNSLENFEAEVWLHSLFSRRFLKKGDLIGCYPRCRHFARFFQILAKNMNLQRFLQKNLFLARFLQTILIFQEFCRKRNSCKNRVKILQETPSQPKSSKIGRLVMFCKILQDSVRLMHYLPSSCQNLAKILKEKHFVSTKVHWVFFFKSRSQRTVGAAQIKFRLNSCKILSYSVFSL